MAKSTDFYYHKPHQRRFGGWTLRKRGSDFLLQAKSSPAAKRTPAQLLALSLYTFHVHRWSTLSDPNKGTWYWYSANRSWQDSSGAWRYTPAQDCFAALNQRLSLADLPPVDEWDGSAAPGPILDLLAEDGQQEMMISWTDPLTDDAWLTFYTLGPISPGRALDVSRLRRQGSQVSSAGSFFLYDIQPGYYWIAAVPWWTRNGDPGPLASTSVTITRRP